MGIIKYDKFLEKAIRRDDDSHLNNPLNDKSDIWDSWGGNEYSGHSNLNMDGEFGNDIDDDIYVDNDDDDDDDEDYEEDEFTDIEDADMNHLVYLLRSMFKNVGIEVDIDYKGLDIMIYCAMNRRERLKDIIAVFSVANKLKKDILPQYTSEFEIYETKRDIPMMVFNFYYEEVGSSSPFK